MFEEGVRACQDTRKSKTKMKTKEVTAWAQIGTHILLLAAYLWNQCVLKYIFSDRLVVPCMRPGILFAPILLGTSRNLFNPFRTSGVEFDPFRDKNFPPPLDRQCLLIWSCIVKTTIQQLSRLNKRDLSLCIWKTCPEPPSRTGLCLWAKRVSMKDWLDLLRHVTCLPSWEVRISYLFPVIFSEEVWESLVECFKPSWNYHLGTFHVKSSYFWSTFFSRQKFSPKRVNLLLFHSSPFVIFSLCPLCTFWLVFIFFCLASLVYKKGQRKKSTTPMITRSH